MKGSFGSARFRFVKVNGRMVKVDLDRADLAFKKFEKDERIVKCPKKVEKVYP